MTENLISVVDDDESVRRTTTLLIESFGFRAAAFESGETFLRSGNLHDTSSLIVDHEHDWSYVHHGWPPIYGTVRALDLCFTPQFAPAIVPVEEP